MGREQRVVRIIDDKRARHHQAGRQRVSKHVQLEDREQRRPHLAALQFLLPLVLDPDLGFFDVYPNPDDQEGGQDADHQQAPPADVVVEQTVDPARQQEAEGWRRFELTYRINIKDSASDTDVRLRVPVPQDALDYQRVLDLSWRSPVATHVLWESTSRAPIVSD